MPLICQKRLKIKKIITKIFIFDFINKENIFLGSGSPSMDGFEVVDFPKVLMKKSCSDNELEGRISFFHDMSQSFFVGH